MPVPFRLMRDALRNLSFEPEEQRNALAGTVVTDELALDLDHALGALEHASELGGLRLPPEVVEGVRRLDARFVAAGPDDPVWDDEALERHPLWAEARAMARTLLPLLPQSDG